MHFDGELIVFSCRLESQLSRDGVIAKTVFELEDNSRTTFCGLCLEQYWPLDDFDECNRDFGYMRKYVELLGDNQWLGSALEPVRIVGLCSNICSSD